MGGECEGRARIRSVGKNCVRGFQIGNALASLNSEVFFFGAHRSAGRGPGSRRIISEGFGGDRHRRGDPLATPTAWGVPGGPDCPPSAEGDRTCLLRGLKRTRQWNHVGSSETIRRAFRSLRNTLPRRSAIPVAGRSTSSTPRR